MEELSLLKKLERVKAPPGFEQRVMAQLSVRRRGLVRRRRVFKLSLAGAFAGLLVVFILLDIFVLQKQAAPGAATIAQETSPLFGASEGVESRSLVPIIETLDYSTEIRSRTEEPRALYLLEEVSDRTLREIKY